LATLATDKVWQVLFSVAIAIGLFVIFLAAYEGAYDLLRYPPWRDREFWPLQIGILLAFLSTFAMLYQASAERLTFTTENRSSRLRAMMLVQQALLVGWLAYACAAEGPIHRGFFSMRDAIIMVSLIGCVTSMLYWYGMGAIMSGESIAISQRVKRSLPKSFLGRAFLTWFYPGPATGYVFALANLASVMFVSLLAVFFVENNPQHIRIFTLFTLTGFFYVAGYLGLGNLLLYLIRRVSTVTLFTGTVIQCLLVLIGVATPWLIAEINGTYVRSYTLLHVTDPFWSCAMFLEGQGLTPTKETIPWLVVPPALIIFILNLIYVAPRVRERTAAKPLRMIEEDATFAPPPSAAEPASPWDE
jgi:hypothetical protein